MKMNIKRILRGWLPPQPSTLQRIKQHSLPIAVGFIITLISVSAFASYTFISNVKPLPITPSVNETIPEITPKPESTTPPLNVTKVTKEQALALAMSFIQQYATENNYTITNITTSFGWGSDDGERGGLTVPQVLDLVDSGLSPSDAHNKFSYYPIWSIDAAFQREQFLETGAHSYIVGYQVGIWADTGEIKYKGEMGCY